MPRKVLYYRQSALTRLPPLISSSRAGQRQEVDQLIAQGVDVNQQGEYDISALHLAALHGHTDTVERLLRGGAHPNSRDAWGCTPLHNAAGKGFSEIVKLLVQAGADVHIRADKGKTGLDLARERGHMDVVRCLQLALQRRQRGYQSRAEIDKEEGEEDIEKEERGIVVDNNNHEDEHGEADTSAVEEPNSVMKELGQLRMQLSRLEEDRGREIGALQARIEQLDRQMTDSYNPNCC